MKSTPRVLHDGLHWMAAIGLILGLLAGGCSDDPPGHATPEIAGTYTDQFGDTHEITHDTWTVLSVFGDSIVHLKAVSNFENFAAGQNDSVTSFNPDKYSRLDWTFFNGDIYMCTTVFNADTLTAALQGEADSTNPPAGGCDAVNDFSWTNLTPP